MFGKKVLMVQFDQVRSVRGVVEDKAENKIRARIMSSLKCQTKNMEFFQWTVVGH